MYRADAARAALEGPPEPNRLPSQLIKPSGKLVWFLDRQAASLLTHTPTTGG